MYLPFHKRLIVPYQHYSNQLYLYPDIHPQDIAIFVFQISKQHQHPQNLYLSILCATKITNSKENIFNKNQIICNLKKKKRKRQSSFEEKIKTCITCRIHYNSLQFFFLLKGLTVNLSFNTIINNHIQIISMTQKYLTVFNS